MPALQEAPPANCPKCSGAIVIERDWHGTYGSCIMCGYVHEVLTRPPVDLAAEEAAMPVRQRRRQPSHGKLRLQSFSKFFLRKFAFPFLKGVYLL